MKNAKILTPEVCTVDKDGELHITNNNFNKSFLLKKAYEIVVPEKINGITVTAIGSYTFKNFNNLQNIELPETIVKIGIEAFAGCTNLSRINLPKNLSSIGDRVFYNCENLESIVIPENIEHINNMTFANCKKLTSVKMSNNVSYIDTSVFYNCENLKSVELSSKINAIGIGAFGGCKSLKYIELPASLSYMVPDVFMNCKNLKIIYKGTETQLKNMLFVHAKYSDFNKQNITIISTKEIDDCIVNKFYDKLPYCIKNKSQQKYVNDKMNNLINSTMDLNNKLELLTISDNINKHKATVINDNLEK